MVGTIPKVQVCYSLTFYKYLLRKEKTFSKFVTTSNEVMKKRQKERAMHELEFREFKFKFKQKKIKAKRLLLGNLMITKNLMIIQVSSISLPYVSQRGYI